MSRSALMCALVLALCTSVQPTHAQMSQFKGFTAISKELSIRLAPKDAPIELDRFLPAEDMEGLLGTWTTFGAEHSFQNGLPNSINMVIWYVTLSRFGMSIGASCQTPQLEFHPRFAGVLQKLCAWPAAGARADPVMLDFWLSVMGHNAPEAEYIAWREFFLRSYEDKAAAETIAAMTLAITMNPYFLLHK